MLGKSLFACGLTVSGFVATTQAATVTWGTPTNISGDSDVHTSDIFVAAYNVGNTGVGAATVNGVTFDPFEIPDGDSTATHGGYTITSAYIFGGIPMTTAAGLGSANAPFTSLTSDYQQLLSSGVASTSFEFFNLNLSGLTIGYNYTLQLWANDSTPTYDGEPFTVFGDPDTTLDANTTGTNGGTGQFVIGAFTADAISQDIGLGGFIVYPGGSPILNAFELRTSLPEPGSIGLLFAGMGMMLRRRRTSHI